MKVRLKGGSLSGTYLIKEDNKQYVRKEISLKENREYGFQRWYSQLKRIQRYSVLFPKLFPKLLGYGIIKSEDKAYFDIEYIDNSYNGFDFLCNTTSKTKIDKFIKTLKRSMDEMYKMKMTSDSNSIGLYIREEVNQRLLDCNHNKNFKKFLEYKEIVFNNEIIPSLIYKLEEYKTLASNNYINPIETFTHGNLTLENIVYSPDTDEVYFIDPYEENIIDSPLAEYSQLLQSSNSLYELYNQSTPIVSGNQVKIDVKIPEGLSYFNTKLNKIIDSNFNNKDIKIIKILEISQFIRMLPFKAIVDENKMVFFYSLASKLLNDLLKYE